MILNPCSSFSLVLFNMASSQKPDSRVVTSQSQQTRWLENGREFQDKQQETLLGEGPDFCQKLGRGHLSLFILYTSCPCTTDCLLYHLFFGDAFASVVVFFLGNPSHVLLCLCSDSIQRWRTQNQRWRSLLHCLNMTQANP